MAIKLINKYIAYVYVYIYIYKYININKYAPSFILFITILHNIQKYIFLRISLGHLFLVKLIYIYI